MQPPPARVFIAEDSELLRTQISRCIEEAGFSIAGQAASARMAIAEIRRLRPEIVVVDLQLLDGTGWEVIDAVGTLPRHLLILSNSGDGLSRSAAALRGVRHFFDKTTQFEDFIECLHGLAGASRRET